MPNPAALGADLSGVIPFVWEKVAAFINKRQEKAGLLAAYSFELNTNLDLLDAIKDGALSGVTIADRAFRGLVSRLHTEVAVSILFSSNRKNYRDFVSLLKGHLDSSDGFKTENESDGEGPAGEELSIDSVLAAMNFSIRKIEALKSLSAIAVEGSAIFPDYRLAVRVRNIKKTLLLLRKCVNRISLEG